MKVKDTLAIIAGLLILTQFIYWIIEQLNVQEKVGTEVSIFISLEFTLFIFIILILLQMQQRLDGMQLNLGKVQHSLEQVEQRLGGIETCFLQKKDIDSPINKKGYIDARLLFIPLVLFLLYLLYRLIILKLHQS